MEQFLRTHRILSENLKGVAHTACGHYGEQVEKLPEQYRLLVQGPKQKFFWAKSQSWTGVDCLRCLKQKR